MAVTAASYFIKTFGCKVNQVESDEVHATLSGRRMVSAATAADASILIVNTCTVTAEADRKVRKELRRLARQPNTSVVIVTGCSAVLLKEQLEELDQKIKVIADRDKISDYIFQLAETYGEHFPSSFADTKRIRVPVKVQDGCEDFCSYCIVPFARGACTSISSDDIVARIQALAETGTKEAVLTGINLGNYESGIPVLLSRIQRETDIYRVRLSSIEPRHVTDELLAFMKFAGDKPGLLCEHLHIPLQSGSDYILSEMNRKYSVDDFCAVVKRIREACPHAAISTDVIVGYPGEGEDDFRQTLELVREIGFAKAHVFRYSRREGTAAALLEPLDPHIVKWRAQALQEQVDMDALRYLESRKGKELEMVVEAINKDAGTISGTTREYLRLTRPHTNQRPGDLINFSILA